MASVDAPIIVIVGETASGKSQLAMNLARRFNGSIVCADAWTVYKGFDIGTAKPSAQERAEIPHYMLDVADPLDGYSAALYKRQAEEALQHVRRDNRLPIVVGGTGLYVDSLLYDYTFLPPGDKEERQLLNSMGISTLLDLASSRNIETAGVDTRNKRRIIRLIESNGELPKKKGLRPRALVLGISYDREILDARIANRVEAMIQRGLQKEVAGMAQKYGWDVEPMKGIGYREFRLFFDGKQTLEQTQQAIVGSTKQLAKKQRTWFKRNEDIQWINDTVTVEKLVYAFLNKNSTTVDSI